MKDAYPGVLLIGYGNPGRLDDGLGPALAAALDKRNLPGLAVDSDYQLTVEDSHDAAQYDVVVFADAAATGPEPFFMKRIYPASSAPGFSSHGVEPGEVLALARDVFQATPQAFALGIRGYEFNEFAERLSDRACRNLHAAADSLAAVVRDKAWSAVDAQAPAPEPQSVNRNLNAV